MLRAVAFSCPSVSAVWSHMLSIAQEFYKICPGIDPFPISQCRGGFLYHLLFLSIYLINPHDDSMTEGFITLFFRSKTWVQTGWLLQAVAARMLLCRHRDPDSSDSCGVVRVFSPLVKDLLHISLLVPCPWGLRAAWGPSGCSLQHLHGTDSTDNKSASRWQLAQGHMTTKWQAKIWTQKVWTPRLASKAIFHSDLRCHSPASSQYPLSGRKAYPQTKPIYASERLPLGGFHCCVSLQASWQCLTLKTKTKYYFDETKEKQLEIGAVSCQQTT